MKILFLINSLAKGGSEKVTLELAEKMSKKSEVKIVTVQSIHDFRSNVPVIALSDLKSMTQAFFMHKQLIAKFKEIVLQEKPGVVISFLEQSNIINIKTRKELQKVGIDYKCIISVRANPSHVYEHGVYGAIFRRLIRRYYHEADLVITNSLLSKKDLQDNFGVPGKKLKTIYNPLNLSKIQKLAKESLSNQHPEIKEIFSGKYNVLITVGRLNYLKAQDRMISAFAKLKKEVKNAKLVIISDGELKEYLQDFSKRLGVDHDVHFLGSQDNPYKFMAKSDVFVFTSLYEGFPNVILEAIAIGLPVVSTDCRSGPREILAPETDPFKIAEGVESCSLGVLVPTFGGVTEKLQIERREELLKKAIINVLNSPKLKKDHNLSGPKRAKDFDAQKIADKFYKQFS